MNNCRKDRSYCLLSITLAGIYLLKVNSGKTEQCKICSKLTVKTPDWRHHVFLMITLNQFDILFWCFHFCFQQVNTGWDAASNNILRSSCSEVLRKIDFWIISENSHKRSPMESACNKVTYRRSANSLEMSSTAACTRSKYCYEELIHARFFQ